MDFNYYMPTKIIFGSDKFNNIKKYVDEFKVKNVLLVTGKTAMKKLGYTDRLLDALKDYSVAIFDQVEPNPYMSIVETCKKVAIKNNIELIIALGGGSTIDVAKAVGLLMTNKGTAKDYLYQKIPIKNKALPLIAIPTTSGTGSEVTLASVLVDEEVNRKRSIRDLSIYPAIAIIDPKLTLTLPAKITTHTGIDALSHAIESYLSINNPNPISKMYSLKSIKLIFDNLKKAIDDPKNLKARTNMSLASFYAGMAFTQTGTIASHSFSCPLTTFFNIDHGYACCLTLPAFLKAYSSVREKDILEMAKVINCNSVDKFSNEIRNFMKSVGTETKLSKLGISKKDKTKIVEETMLSVTGRDPIEITKDILEKIFDETF